MSHVCAFYYMSLSITLKCLHLRQTLALVKQSVFGLFALLYLLESC